MEFHLSVVAQMSDQVRKVDPSYVQEEGGEPVTEWVEQDRLRPHAPKECAHLVQGLQVGLKAGSLSGKALTAWVRRWATRLRCSTRMAGGLLSWSRGMQTSSARSLPHGSSH